MKNSVTQRRIPWRDLSVKTTKEILSELEGR